MASRVGVQISIRTWNSLPCGTQKENAHRPGAFLQIIEEGAKFGRGNSSTHSTWFLCVNVEQNRFLIRDGNVTNDQGILRVAFPLA